MCAWPKIGESKIDRPSQTERRASQRRERQDEAERLRALLERRIGSPSSEARSTQNFALLSKIHDKIRSLEFRSWFEMTTGEPAEQWIAKVVISPSDFVQTRHFAAWPDQLRWTEQQIRNVAERNPWRDPEQRNFWGAEVAACDDPRRRRAMLIRLGTPAWANRAKMLEIYKQRAILDEETGVPHAVDHIVPVVHRLVCGLHWEGNLQIITEAENARKSNSFDPNTFSC